MFKVLSKTHLLKEALPITPSSAPIMSALGLLSGWHARKTLLFFVVLILFIYLFVLAALGLLCCMWAFSSCSEQVYSSLQCAGFSLLWLLSLRSTGSRQAGFNSYGEGSVVVACGL